MPPDASGRYPDNLGDYRTYANAVFVNKTIILPVYAQQYDTTAVRIWKEALPGYSIKTINCNSIITALGAIHCITKEVASSNPLLISHQPLHDSHNQTAPYQIDARILHRSGIDSATMYFRTDTTQPYLHLTMALTNGATNTWTGFIPAQPAASTVYYYIEASSVSGKTQVRPLPAPAAYWKFNILLNVGLEETPTQSGLELLPAFPNPSKGITCIPVTGNRSVEMTLTMKDLLGRTVNQIFTGRIPVGKKNYFMNTESLSSGVYLIELKTDEKSHIQKLIVR